jgi:hypothetical protein
MKLDACKVGSSLYMIKWLLGIVLYMDDQESNLSVTKDNIGDSS